MLPLEKICLAQECRKLYAYCTVGNSKVVSILFDFLKASPNSEVRHRALFESFLFADQLLAHHDQDLMNKIREFLIEHVSKADTPAEIK